MIPAQELAGRLRDDLERLVDELLPGGRLEGGEWRATGPDGAVWSVVMRGSKRGVFSDWGDDRARGDALELVRWAACQGDRKQAYQWALRFLGEDRQAQHSPRPASPPRPSSAELAQRQAEEAERTRRSAHALWLAGTPIAGTPAAGYLAGRGLGLERFPPDSLNALRFHPTVRHPTGVSLPALLAAIVDPVAGRFLAVQRIFLEQAGGTWRKTQLRPAKPVLGAVRGGLIPLLRGRSRKPLKEAPEDDELVIGEGIENTLTVAAAYPSMRAVAAVSVGNLANITLPPGICGVMLVCDRDGENDAVNAQRSRALARWCEENRATTMWRPELGFKDANEWWLDVLCRAPARSINAQPGRRAG